jgi:molybdopterin synthase catalytic subunit
MSEEKIKSRKKFLNDGPISPEAIAESIAKHSAKKNIGAHDIFLGQVRMDIIEGKVVKAIEYSAYNEMAEEAIEKIREETIVKHHLTCAHVMHSTGLINAGEICFFVFVSSVHRQAAFDGCREMVERIKKEAPIFGKENFEDGGYVWKENKF